MATWNMDHWKRTVDGRKEAWGFLPTVAGVDVALLQECVPPAGPSPARAIYREIGWGRHWGSAVASFREDLPLREVGAVRTRYGSTRYPMLGHIPGAMIAAVGEVPDVGPITFVSLYGAGDGGHYCQNTVLRFVADLIPLFDSPLGERVILGGDLNITTAVHPNTRELPRYEAIFQAIESLGLLNVAETAEVRPPPPEDCFCASPECQHLKTFEGGIGGQLDWLFASPELARRCRSVRVEWDRSRHLSDHAPIVAEFSLPRAFPDREWDPESFVAEVAVRSGPEAGRVAGEIVAWAERKHQDLRKGGRRLASLDRLPTSTGELPELWIQLDLDYPHHIGYTVSMRADGRMTVQFQYMRYPPFDTDEGRKELWSRIQALPGVELERRLNGRPTFPIEALAREGNLERFLEILDWAVGETVEQRSAGPGDP